jgi:lactate dehydrogenase-like 2-hydroxyacid dehydrogenase
MKIAVLSFSFLTPAHIARLKKIGEVFEYESSRAEGEAVDRLGGVEVAVADCWDVSMDRKFFESVPSVRFISLNSTGFDRVDADAAKKHGIAIAHVPGFSTEAVAEEAIALMFAVARLVTKGNAVMHSAPFQVDPGNRSHDAFKGVELKGKTFGIVGFGKIGQRIAEIGEGVGMKVIAYNRSPKNVPSIQMVDFDTLLMQSDFVSINSAYIPEMKNMFSKDQFAKMKRGVVLINTARADFLLMNQLWSMLSKAARSVDLALTALSMNLLPILC